MAVSSSEEGTASLSRRQFIRSCSGAAALAALGLKGCRGRERPPNILLFAADDMGWTDTGFMGGDFHETPYLDRLAAASESACPRSAESGIPGMIF